MKAHNKCKYYKKKEGKVQMTLKEKYTIKNGKRVVSKDVLQPGTYKKKWRSSYNYKDNGRVIGRSDC